MPEFNKWILVNSKVLNFEFSKVIRTSGNKYFVNVFDQQILKASFEVKDKRNGNWEILLPVPWWILDVQDKIIQAIEEHMQV